MSATITNLASKYRPSTFEDMTEQTLIVDILKSMCNEDPLRIRNFLLVGPAGVGKTSLARILANMINKGQGDPIEIDAASHNGIDTVRDIVQQSKQYPIGCKYKVFICQSHRSMYRKCHSFIIFIGRQANIYTITSYLAFHPSIL